MSRRGSRAEEIRVAVPLLGTTWYDRGVAYWLRRAGLAALMIIGLVCMLTAVWGFVMGAWEFHPAVGPSLRP